MTGRAIHVFFPSMLTVVQALARQAKMDGLMSKFVGYRSNIVSYSSKLVGYRSKTVDYPSKGVGYRSKLVSNPSKLEGIS